MMLNDEGRKLVAGQVERCEVAPDEPMFPLLISREQWEADWETRIASYSASATDSCARCLGSSLTEADQQLIANQRRNYNLPAGGVVYHNKAEPLVRDGTLMLNSKTEEEYFRRLAARDDTAASLLRLVEQDKLSWDEYERRLEAVLRREDKAEAKTQRPQGSKLSLDDAVWIVCMLVIFLGPVLWLGLTWSGV